MPYAKAQDARRQIEELLAGGFIRVFESSWAAPYIMGLLVNAEGIRCDDDYAQVAHLQAADVDQGDRALLGAGGLARLLHSELEPTHGQADHHGKKTFVWSDEHQEHFDAIQRAVHDTKLLRPYQCLS